MIPTVYSEWWGNLALDVAVILLACTLDRFLPELPARIHPVVWMGRTIAALERLAPGRPAPAFVYGALVALLTIGAWGALAWLIVFGLSELGPIAYVLGGALLLRVSFTLRGLTSAAAETQAALETRNLELARERLMSLVSRDRASLSAPLVAASAIESVAENTTDSYISPWLAFVVIGAPGAIAYRVANTLDSMWGKRGRYEYLGKFGARLDDAINLVPARLSAMLLLLGGLLIGSPFRRGWKIMWRDQRITESPNAGWTMAAMSGLLGRRLEKLDHYDLGSEFPEPDADDIGRSNRIAEVVGLLGIVLALGVLALRHWVAA